MPDVGEVPLREARAITAGYRGDLARGVDVFAAARQAKDSPKVTTLEAAYKLLVSRPDMRPSTLRDYASLWLLIPAIMKSRRLDEIGETEIRKLHTEVGARHPRTANKLLALLSVLIRRSGRRHDNPVSSIERFRQESRQRVMTTDELQRLRASLKAEAEPWRSFFLLALLTGARGGALARMQWTDIDLDAATWCIPAVCCGQSGSPRKRRSSSRTNAHCSGSPDCLQGSTSNAITAFGPPRTRPVFADDDVIRNSLSGVCPSVQGLFSPLASICVSGRLPAWDGSTCGESGL